jgi:hypothetical protein
MKLIWSDQTRTVRRDNMTIVLKHAESRGFQNWLVTERLQRKQSIQRTVDTKLTAIAESAPAIVTGKVYRQDTEVAGAQLAIIYGVKEDRYQGERITGQYRFVVCMAAEADRAALAAFGKQVSK